MYCSVRILHFSDLHGNFNPFFAWRGADFDLYINTGDHAPNHMIGRGKDEKLRPSKDEEKDKLYQSNWLYGHHKKEQLLQKIMDQLNGRPFIEVRGNHDVISIAEELNNSGYPNAYRILPGRIIELCGLRFAGFEENPETGGDWYRETIFWNLHDATDKALSLNPDVLLTHAPPLGVLDRGFGISGLMKRLQHSTVCYHFFGHVHETGGSDRIISWEDSITEEEKSIRFINGACCAKEIRIEE
jgi:Icc-related predicted phosphoesterase